MLETDIGAQTMFEITSFTGKSAVFSPFGFAPVRVDRADRQYYRPPHTKAERRRLRRLWWLCSTLVDIDDLAAPRDHRPGSAAAS
jgi:hypothetical protein